ncbi:Phosphatidate phosphatase APP1 [Psilocybe cubensis]|uniref:Phosphatidate phosphatase APP1 catalytic domain-containing protein n=2 Tax=Psilocybe cubensis TaxID=181762 RepID=A0A8H7XTY8_PSICU|nr:Phosphatidate phosphatase APP1 [Psilocybe cubensis]KAH9479808.1 Phosphatidate phosphatase APP1 [Psilocybe cubensis]
MSEDMPSSWRYLTSAGNRISSFKGYLSGREPGAGWRSGRTTPNASQAPRDEPRQSWRAWAGQKIRVRRRGQYDATESNELINIFPGWAARRYASQQDEYGRGPRPFELEVFVSGYAISYRSPENASRSQRAFIRLAKGFASLPKIVDSAADVRPNSSSFAQLTPSTEALLAQVKLPPRPTDIADDYDIDALERQLRLAKTTDDPLKDDSASLSSSSSASSSTNDLPSTGRETADSVVNSVAENTADVIKRLHANLERRLQPFWSSTLPNRVVRLHLFSAPHNDSSSTSVGPGNTDDVDELATDAQNGPLASQDVMTGVDGSFQVKFNIPWEDLCHHPRALHIAFGEAEVEHELLIVAQLLPLNPSSSSLSVDSSPTSTPLTSLTRIPVTYSPIRVISDIDDTVKFSGVLSGARAVFHNVFVKDLRDNVIPGMGEWYAAMWSRGVRFHYVSNGPFEILPVLNEFFEVSQLPPGSIKLKSYAGRSLFTGLLSAPAARKRAGIVDILDSFPDSRFFLIGDSGEQDLELYADIARERPDRILAVFVRDADANTFGGPPALEDPTGWKAMGAAGTRPIERPLVSRSESGMTNGSFSPSISSYSKYSSFFSSNSGSSTPNVRTGDANETPRPNTFGFDSGRQPSTSASVDDKALAKARDQSYLGVGALTAEPESMRSGDAVTPPRLSAVTGPAIYVNSPNNSSREPQDVMQSPGKFVDQPPKATPPPSIRSSMSSLGPASAAASFRSQRTGSSTSSGSSNTTGKRISSISEAEKKRNDLQMRVYRARTQMPSHIPLRIFRDPSECVEAQEILDQER